jgi:type IV secretory pathway component VirB8
VLLDLQTRAWDTEGIRTEDHATATLSLDDARRLVAELAAAVEQAGAIAQQPSAPVWSPTTASNLTPAVRPVRHPNRRRAA